MCHRPLTRPMIPLLVDASPDHPSFHVVAFSLPGYGFSEAPKKKGFAFPQYAEVGAQSSLDGSCSIKQVGHKLMLALGYTEYGKSSITSTYADIDLLAVVQGGDWGAFVSTVHLDHHSCQTLTPSTDHT